REIVKLCLFKVVLKRFTGTPRAHSTSWSHCQKRQDSELQRRASARRGIAKLIQPGFAPVQWGSDGAFVAKPFEEPAVKITNSPLDPAITVGTCNWVYEEEILESSDAFWVSPATSASPTWCSTTRPCRAYRNALAGSRAPLTKVSLRVYDIASRRTIELSKPMAVPQEHYVTLFFRHIQRKRLMDFNKQKASEPLMDPASERLFIVLHKFWLSENCRRSE
uniref:DPPIV_N domain-containing protein n=1 Tax=Macrostomum lignano TaxID=282301 RepID=A0A1I8FB56_9PLAT